MFGGLILEEIRISRRYWVGSVYPVANSPELMVLDRKKEYLSSRE
jgi:hypothetical protein